jgi:hypothetical protein
LLLLSVIVVVAVIEFFLSCVLRFICFKIFERSFELVGFLRFLVRFVTISSLPFEASDDEDDER